MRLSRLFFQTLREAPKEADTASHRLMVRASLIRQVASGIYEFLPLGFRAVRKVAAIVREEMDRAGAQEVLLPQLNPRELWEETGRWKEYGKELMRLEDRHERDFALGPTHEELMTDLARAVVRSYRKLPVTLYQIQTKFRDEIRPRFGIMRAREFMMKDAYSFDVDEAGVEKSYEAMRVAYNRIFARLGLNYRMVEADTGLIGGKFSHEFMVLADTGEEVLATCPGCEYAASKDKAEPLGSARAGSSDPAGGQAGGAPEEVPPPHPVPTPGAKSVEDVARVLKRPVAEIGKILFYEADGALVGAFVRGDHVLNETKLKNHLGAAELALAKPEKVAAELEVPVGFIGPAGLKPVRVVFDRDAAAMVRLVTGANRPDEHLVDVKPGRDFEVKETAQLRDVMEGDACPRCEKPFKLIRGIEVGHIFKLGTKYSGAMRAAFLDEKGAEREMLMGCYGIGVTRIVAAAIEQNHDDRGIIWPEAIAPYRVAIIPLGKDGANAAAAEELYAGLTEAGVDALLDDRAETPGVKFADADLIGIPWQVVVGRTFQAEGLVEVRKRGDKTSAKVKPGQVRQTIDQ